MKRAQVEQFLGIALLVLALVGFVMYTKVSSIKSETASTVGLVNVYERNARIIATTTMTKIKIRGFELGSYWSDMICTNSSIVSHLSMRVNVTAETIRKLDLLFGQNRWRLELYGASNHRSIGTATLRSPQVYDFSFDDTCAQSVGIGKIHVGK